MDWKTFFASLVDSVAWPLVAALIVWQLRDKIAELLPRVRKLRHKETEIEFSEGVRELEAEVSAKSDEPHTEAGATSEAKDEFNRLMQLAGFSSRAAVQEAWRKVESAAAKAAAKTYPDLSEKRALPLHQHLKALRGRILSDAEYKQLEQLRRLRNMAAHDDDFDLQGHPIEAYLDIALSMAWKLESYDP